ncbi:MAG: DNA-methyltransferase [Candidatus Brocadiia bacterium]
MKKKHLKCRPGEVRDAIVRALRSSSRARSAKELAQDVSESMGGVAASSVRSYLRLNTPGMFVRELRGVYRLRDMQTALPVPRAALPTPLRPAFTYGNTTLYCDDCFEWLARQDDNCIHAVVTDPPYGLHEYTPEQQAKLRNGKGGVWRIPPSFDGTRRAPLPRFTTLTADQLEELREFFRRFGRALLPKLTPGANVLVASNPLLSHIVADGLSQSGLERRGELVRLVMTLRGGDRPKAAHEEFSQVSVMPRSMWEPWLIYRKPLEGRAQDNLRKWQTGGFRRPSPQRPFGDVIRSSPTRKEERSLAPHPSLKPQAFMRQLVYGALPLGRGTVLDPFAGSGSTLAAAEAVGYRSIGVEKDPHYFDVASRAIPKLASLHAYPPRRPLCESSRFPPHPSLRAPHIKSQFSARKRV